MPTKTPYIEPWAWRPATPPVTWPPGPTVGADDDRSDNAKGPVAPGRYDDTSTRYDPAAGSVTCTVLLVSSGRVSSLNHRCPPGAMSASVGSKADDSRRSVTMSPCLPSRR
jgi:hypothetical protein